MKVKLINPSARENNVRGIGVYGENLTRALEKISGLEITNINPDLTHFLYFDPFFLTLPLIRKEKTVVTVFDLTEIILKNLYPRGIRGEIKWQIQKKLLKTADAIITISQSAKKDIEKLTGISENKIFVTYLAAGENYKNLNIKKENFVLYIGDINPNKNLSSLFKAIALLKNEKLVMIGKTLAQSLEIKKEIKFLGIQDKVTLTGYVSEEDKINLINKAKVYVQPSIYEGFCLPVLEAMACGTPVICGRNSSLPEVAGNAATYADVTNVNDLADKIKNIKNDSGQARMTQAAKFNWKRTAKETYEVYQKILAGK